LFKETPDYTYDHPYFYVLCGQKTDGHSIVASDNKSDKEVAVERYDNCFVCGENNPIGMKLSFLTTSDGKSRAEFNLSKDFEGYNDVIHGGIVASLLDEAMAKAIMAMGLKAMTVNLNINYKMALSPQQEYSVEGVVTRQRKKIIEAAAKIFRGDLLFAEGKAKFFLVTSK
jgi:uncharacterized protein (TIGR00369 family)